MVYNKEAIYKYKENNPEQYKNSTRQATSNYKSKNIDAVREKARNYARFITEVKRFRNIDIF